MNLFFWNCLFDALDETLSEEYEWICESLIILILIGVYAKNYLFGDALKLLLFDY